jgi:hypothetical protein
MDSFAYACVAVNKPIVDIDDLWKPFVPAWYLNRPTTSLPSSTATPGLNSSTVAASNTPTVTSVSESSHLSEGAVAGVVVGGVLAFSAMAVCSTFYWRARKKLKRKSKENAEIADALQNNGFTRRIDQLNYRTPSTESVVAPVAQHDAYGHDAYSHYKPHLSTQRYHPARFLVPGSAPISDIWHAHSRDSTGSTAVASDPDPYGHYKPSAVPEVDRYPSNHSRSCSSPDSPGRTPVTASSLQRHTIDPYQAYKPCAGLEGAINNDVPYNTGPSTSRKAMSKTNSPVQPYSQDHDPVEIRSATPPMYDTYGRKITYR